MTDELPEDAVFRPLTVRIREACRLTGIGRSKLYELIAAGDIEIVKVGTLRSYPSPGWSDFFNARLAEPHSWASSLAES